MSSGLKETNVNVGGEGSNIRSGAELTTGQKFSTGAQAQLSGMTQNQTSGSGGQLGETTSIDTGLSSTGLGLAKGMGDLSGMGTGQSLPEPYNSKIARLVNEERDYGFAGICGMCGTSESVQGTHTH